MSTGWRRVRQWGEYLATAIYPEGSRRDEELAAVESRGTYTAAGAFAFAALVGLIVFFGREIPLWGQFSVGTVATIVAVVCGIVGTVMGYVASWRTPTGQWRKGLHVVQRIIDTVTITLLQVTILALVMLVVFALLQQGFQDLTVDTFTGLMITATLSAITAYTSYLSAVHLDARRLAGLLAAFVVAGVTVSMVTATQADWWRYHFSELGAGTGVSSDSFNLTLILAGLVLATLGLYIAADLRRWEKTVAPSRTRNIPLVQAAFVVIGVGLAGVGLVPVTTSLILHNTFATGLGLAFVALLVGLRWCLDGLPRAVFVFSDALLIGIGVATLLWWPVKYYNLTALELIASALIFTWLIVFVRNIGALVAQLPQTQVERRQHSHHGQPDLDAVRS